MKPLIALALLAALSGCSGGGEGQRADRSGDPTPEERAHPGGTTPPSLPPMAMNPIRSAPLPATEHFPAPHDPVLIPGDLLAISVYDEPDLALSIRVPDTGAFAFPLIGDVEAMGRSPRTVEASIRERLTKRFVQNPQVTVTVTEFAPRQVYILGGVAKPSGYTLPPTQRLTLLQLISVAGGITDKAYKEFVEIVRLGPKGEREVLNLSLVDVESAIAQGKPEADVVLQPDDLVMIPSAARVVYVLGEVKDPGWFDIPADTKMTASMAISRAGSFTRFAATSSIQVLRRTPGQNATKISVNLDDIVHGKLDSDIVLEPGDVVWVPERGIF